MSTLPGTWTRFHSARRCGGCDALIAGGEPVYVTRSKLLRCVTCVKRLWNEDAPADLPMPAPIMPVAVRTPAPVEFARFDKSFAERARRFFGSRVDAEAGDDR